jgi:hypothetical protein
LNGILPPGVFFAESLANFESRSSAGLELHRRQDAATNALENLKREYLLRADICSVFGLLPSITSFLAVAFTGCVVSIGSGSRGPDRHAPPADCGH